MKWEEPEERDCMALALATVRLAASSQQLANCEDGLGAHRVCSRGS
eukprot:COSAG02_NODE_2566_length_8519_cov_3.109857_4_plen_46_part_00